MSKLFLLIGLLTFFVSCKGEQTITVDTKNVFKSSGVEIPMYSFENLEPLFKINDGKIRVINFWATWCKPCVAELPYFELINSRYSNEEVEVILVSLDLPKHIETKLIPFLKKQKIQSKVIVLDDPDANSWIPKISQEWSGSIPATVIYKGNTSKFYERSFTYNDLESELKKML